MLEEKWSSDSLNKFFYCWKFVRSSLISWEKFHLPRWDDLVKNRIRSENFMGLRWHLWMRVWLFWRSNRKSVTYGFPKKIFFFYFYRTVSCVFVVKSSVEGAIYWCHMFAFVLLRFIWAISTDSFEVSPLFIWWSRHNFKMFLWSGDLNSRLWCWLYCHIGF